MRVPVQPTLLRPRSPSTPAHVPRTPVCCRFAPFCRGQAKPLIQKMPIYLGDLEEKPHCKWYARNPSLSKMFSPVHTCLDAYPDACTQIEQDRFTHGICVDLWYAPMPVPRKVMPLLSLGDQCCTHRASWAREPCAALDISLAWTLVVRLRAADNVNQTLYSSQGSVGAGEGQNLMARWSTHASHNTPSLFGRYPCPCPR